MERRSYWHELLKECDFEKAKKPIFQIMNMMARELQHDYAGTAAREEIRVAVENFFSNPSEATAIKLLNASPCFESAFKYAKDNIFTNVDY